MNCEEISDLLPAYVLGILDPDEVEAVESHLRAGAEHDQELIDLRATVFAMDRYEVEDAVPAPSAALATRVRAITEPASPQAVESQPRRRETSHWFGLPAPMRLAAAAVVLLLVFGAGWLARGALVGGDSTAFAHVLEGPEGALMEVRGAHDKGPVTVIMAGLDRLEGQSYQVWAIRDGEWVSVGVCNTNAEGTWVGDFDFQPRDNDAFALTVEPRGGSPGPTGEFLLGAPN